LECVKVHAEARCRGILEGAERGPGRGRWILEGVQEGAGRDRLILKGVEGGAGCRGILEGVE